MKLMILSFSLLFSTFSYSSELFTCLGKEESHIFKNKIGGAYQKLNRALIGELVLLGETVKLDKEIERTLCSKEVAKPSIYLLKMLITSKKRIFKVKSLKNISSSSESDKKTIETLNQRTFAIFLRFLSDFQADVKDPFCLTKHFPGLKSFYEKTRYVLEEQGEKGVLKEIPNLKKFFDQLQNFNSKKHCLKAQKAPKES